MLFINVVAKGIPLNSLNPMTIFPKPRAQICMRHVYARRIPSLANAPTDTESRQCGITGRQIRAALVERPKPILIPSADAHSRDTRQLGGIVLVNARGSITVLAYPSVTRLRGGEEQLASGLRRVALEELDQHVVVILLLMFGVNDRVSVYAVPEERVAYAIRVAAAAAGVPIEVVCVVGLEVMYIYAGRAGHDNAYDNQI